MADPEFPRRGEGIPKRGTYYLANFSRKLHENEEKLAERGPSPAPSRSTIAVSWPCWLNGKAQWTHALQYFVGAWAFVVPVSSTVNLTNLASYVGRYAMYSQCSEESHEIHGSLEEEHCLFVNVHCEGIDEISGDQPNQSNESLRVGTAGGHCTLK